jgi:hypothetical protein
MGTRAKKHCEWVAPEAADYDVWQTECRNEFMFESDGPLENCFKFCPYCGGEMSIAPREVENLDESPV